MSCRRRSPNCVEQHTSSNFLIPPPNPVSGGFLDDNDDYATENKGNCANYALDFSPAQIALLKARPQDLTPEQQSERRKLQNRNAAAVAREKKKRESQTSAISIQKLKAVILSMQIQHNEMVKALWDRGCFNQGVYEGSEGKVESKNSRSGSKTSSKRVGTSSSRRFTQSDQNGTSSDENSILTSLLYPVDRAVEQCVPFNHALLKPLDQLHPANGVSTVSTPQTRDTVLVENNNNPNHLARAHSGGQSFLTQPPHKLQLPQPIPSSAQSMQMTRQGSSNSLPLQSRLPHAFPHTPLPGAPSVPIVPSSTHITPIPSNSNSPSSSNSPVQSAISSSSTTPDMLPKRSLRLTCSNGSASDPQSFQPLPTALKRPFSMLPPPHTNLQLATTLEEFIANCSQAAIPCQNGSGVHVAKIQNVGQNSLALGQIGAIPTSLHSNNNNNNNNNPSAGFTTHNPSTLVSLLASLPTTTSPTQAGITLSHSGSQPVTLCLKSNHPSPPKFPSSLPLHLPPSSLSSTLLLPTPQAPLRSSSSSASSASSPIPLFSTPSSTLSLPINSQHAGLPCHRA